MKRWGAVKSVEGWKGDGPRVLFVIGKSFNTGYSGRSSDSANVKFGQRGPESVFTDGLV